MKKISDIKYIPSGDHDLKTYNTTPIKRSEDFTGTIAAPKTSYKNSINDLTNLVGEMTKSFMISESMLHDTLGYKPSSISKLEPADDRLVGSFGIPAHRPTENKISDIYYNAASTDLLGKESNAKNTPFNNALLGALVDDKLKESNSSDTYKWYNAKTTTTAIPWYDKPGTPPPYLNQIEPGFAGPIGPAGSTSKKMIISNAKQTDDITISVKNTKGEIVHSIRIEGNDLQIEFNDTIERNPSVDTHIDVKRKTDMTPDTPESAYRRAMAIIEKK